MQYVMVPVPKEIVLDVMRWVLHQAPDEDRDDGVRDRARLTNLVEKADDLTRSLLLLVANATLDGTAPVRLTDAADELGQSTHAIRLALGGLDTPFRHQNVRNLVMVSDETAVGVHGNRGRISFLSMRPQDARIVRAAARAIDARAE